MNLSPLNVTIPTSQKKLGEPYLKIKLERKTFALLPMKYAQEVLVIPVSRLSPIPNMPSCVLGLLNQRSRVFWTIDLPQLLQLPPLDRDASGNALRAYRSQYNLVIIQVGNLPLGLAVLEIQGTIRLSSEEIQSPLGTVLPGLIPYLQGCVLQEKEILLVLDAKAIFSASNLQENAEL